MSRRATASAAFALVMFTAIAASACRAPSATRVTPSTVTVPDFVRQDAGGRRLASVSTTTAGPITVGLAVVGRTFSAGRPFPVVTWVSADTTQTLMLDHAHYSDTLNILVYDASGAVVFDGSSATALMRGPSPSLDPLDQSHPFHAPALVTVDRPGTYRILCVANVRVGTTPSNIRTIAATPPGIVLSVK